MPVEAQGYRIAARGPRGLTHHRSTRDRCLVDFRREALEIEATDHLYILVASLEDVIRSKEAAGREKDRLALPRLRRLLDRLRSGP